MTYSKPFHITDGSRPGWTVDWGYDGPVVSGWSARSWYLQFKTEEEARAFIEQYKTNNAMFDNHRIYQGDVIRCDTISMPGKV